MNNNPPRRKLIEISIPVEAINAAAAREKSIRYGHPSTLHLWWARRPLAACRAILFGQLVDDPSSWPEYFCSAGEIEMERKRLHHIIMSLVDWDSSGNEPVLAAARYEIAASIARSRREIPPRKQESDKVTKYLQDHAPSVVDPFSGGASISLEAQRLGLRANGSDLNPVAVIIGKALVEIPTRFQLARPVNLATDVQANMFKSQNVSEAIRSDIRFYGELVADEAMKRVGHLYRLDSNTSEDRAQPIAWLWARTVRSPDPSAKGAEVPLISSYLLSAKPGKQSWLEPFLDERLPNGYGFNVCNGELSEGNRELVKRGTKAGKGNFVCLLTGTPISEKYLRAEGCAGRIGARLLAVVLEGNRGRTYIAAGSNPKFPIVQEQIGPEGELYEKALGFRVPAYGYRRWVDLFNSRQLTVLTSLVTVIKEMHSRIEADARASGLPSESESLADGGSGARAYADAIVTYLALALDRSAMGGNTLTRWNPVGEKAQHMFGRQAISMIWDFAETNILGNATGSFRSGIEMAVNSLLFSNGVPAIISWRNATQLELREKVLICTDPPYYDNVGYADLSDFFYVWLRMTLGELWPNLFRRLSTPKEEELVATPHRHGGSEQAEAFFMDGMRMALNQIRHVATDDYPACIFYAFKQSETSSDGVTSAGWAAFLQAMVDSGIAIDGTWPLRTEMATRMRGLTSNALASSVVIVCRKRIEDAPTITRAEFVRTLKREMPDSIDDIRNAGVSPVDMQQSVIGPGMGVFTRYTKVLESDDTPMTVKTALTLINRVWEEIENELDANFDPETQVALAWFASYGYETKKSGELNVVANAKNVPERALFDAMVFKNLHGNTALTPRGELTLDWRPSADKHVTVWRCVQQVARMLNAEQGGGEAAAKLVAEMGVRAADAQKLAYRLFEISTRKGLNEEALVYNELAQEWAKLEDLAASPVPAPRAKAQASFQF
jgi:putative DNA methylase